MTQPTILEVTDPRSGKIVPMVLSTMEIAPNVQGLLATRLDVETDIVLAGIDPMKLQITREQQDIAAALMMDLDGVLRADMLCEAEGNQAELTKEYGPTVRCFAAAKAKREVYNQDEVISLSFDS